MSDNRRIVITDLNNRVARGKRNCPKCGEVMAINPHDTIFCPICGEKLEPLPKPRVPVVIEEIPPVKESKLPRWIHFLIGLLHLPEIIAKHFPRPQGK